MNRSHIVRRVAVLCVCVVMTLSAATAGTYMKLDNPPDVDKPDRDDDGSWPDAGDNSCWLASAANLLAAGGWGDGTTIYNTLTGHFGTASGGLQNTALDWYIGSQSNPGTRYSVVTEYNGGSWNDHWTPAFIGSELRRCQFVAIGIWPGSDSPDFTETGHALTVWGDDDPAEGESPGTGYVTDSDQDVGGTDVDSYTWGSAEHNGHTYWYLEDYYGEDQHGYLAHVTTLCPVPLPGSMTLIMIGLALSPALKSKLTAARRSGR